MIDRNRLKHILALCLVFLVMFSAQRASIEAKSTELSNDNGSANGAIPG